MVTDSTWSSPQHHPSGQARVPPLGFQAPVQVTYCLSPPQPWGCACEHESGPGPPLPTALQAPTSLRSKPESSPWPTRSYRICPTPFLPSLPPSLLLVHSASDKRSHKELFSKCTPDLFPNFLQVFAQRSPSWWDAEHPINKTVSTLCPHLSSLFCHVVSTAF